MKKSQLKQLISKIIKESAMGNLHLEITDSIEGLIELGATTDDIRSVLDQIEKERAEDPADVYDNSGKIVPHGTFDVSGKYNREKDIEKSEYTENP